MSRHLVATLLQRKEAYKRLIRDRFRPLKEIAITVEDEELEDEQMDCIKNFHHSLALKLETSCNKAVHVLHTCLVPCPSSTETVVYHKMYALFLLLLLNALTSLSWFLSLFWLMRLCCCWFHVWRCILVTVYAQDRGREDKLC